MNHTTNGLIAVTGATGEVGGRVARRLASRAAVSDIVRRLTGHPPVTLAEYIKAHPDSLGYVSAGLAQTG